MAIISENERKQIIAKHWNTALLDSAAAITKILGTGFAAAYTVGGTVAIGTPLTVAAGLTLYAAKKSWFAFHSYDKGQLSGEFKDRSVYKDIASKFGKTGVNPHDFEHHIQTNDLFKQAVAMNFKNFLSKAMHTCAGMFGRFHSDSESEKQLYNQWTQTEVNMLHLTALLGLDPNKDAMKIKGVDAFRDPAIQALFNDAGDITQALSFNVDNLQVFVKHLGRGLGEDTALMFSDIGNIPNLIESTGKLINDCMVSVDKKRKSNNVRHFLNNIHADLIACSSGGNVPDEKKKAALIKLKKLDVLSTGSYKNELSSTLELRNTLVEQLESGTISTDGYGFIENPNKENIQVLREKLFKDNYPDTPYLIEEKPTFVSVLSKKLYDTLIKSDSFMPGSPNEDRINGASLHRDAILQRTALSMSGEKNITIPVKKSVDRGELEPIKVSSNAPRV